MGSKKQHPKARPENLSRIANACADQHVESNLWGKLSAEAMSRLRALPDKTVRVYAALVSLLNVDAGQVPIDEIADLAVLDNDTTCEHLTLLRRAGLITSRGDEYRLLRKRRSETNGSKTRECSQDTRTPLERIAKHWIKAWQGGDTGIIDELHSIDFVDNSSTDRTPDNKGFKQGLTDLYTAFPDFCCEIEDLSVDQNAAKVTIRWSAKGTHCGTFIGVQPTKRQVLFRGIEILTVRDGRIIARWGEWDGLDIAEQLGALVNS